MGRYTVKYNGKYAAFSTITDSFITEFMDKETYENWAKEEYGKMYYRPVNESEVKTITDATSAIRLNRSHDEALECLREANLSDDEAEKILYDLETKNYCPMPDNKEQYRCPNCNAVVVRGQEICSNESCGLKFLWRQIKSKSFTIDQGNGTKEVFTIKQLKEKAENGEITIEQALTMAYDNALWDMEKMCIEKSRKMSTAKNHTYYRAVGTREIHKCVEQLMKRGG